jgi:glucokinase
MGDRWAIGLDLGGTDLKSGRVAHDGVLQGFSRRPSRTAESPDGPFQALEAAAMELRGSTQGEIVALGVGVPGPIDPRSGSQVGRTAHLPEWQDTPVRQWLEKRLGLPVAVDNDANLAALAEHRMGVARGTRISITITLGTGIGCGIIVDGRVLHGGWGGAGELGHIPLARGTTECACGVPGCVEPEASASGLMRQARERGLEDQSAEALFHRARLGDEEAQAMVEAMVDRLGATVATAVNILNPQLVVVGGGLAKAGDTLLDPLGRAIRRYALASHAKGLRIEPAALGERAGTVGAGILAWERVTRPVAASASRES